MRTNLQALRESEANFLADEGIGFFFIIDRFELSSHYKATESFREQNGEARTNLEALRESEANLLADEGIGFPKDVPSLRVAEDDPLTAEVLDHGGGHLSGEGAFVGLGQNKNNELYFIETGLHR